MARLATRKGPTAWPTGAGRRTLTVGLWDTRPDSQALVWPCGRCAGIGRLLEMWLMAASILILG